MSRALTVIGLIGLMSILSHPAAADPWGWRYRYWPGYVYAPPAYVYTPPAVYYAPAPTVVYISPNQPAAPVAAAPVAPAYTSTVGQNCRPYQTTVVIDNAPQSTVGTACKQADGTWRITQ